MGDTPAPDNAITTYLQRVWDFTPTHAHEARQRLLRAPQALTVLERMMDGDEPESDFVIGGVTYTDLLDKHGLAPIGAVLWWAWVEHDPVAAHEALRRGRERPPIFRSRSNKGGVQ